VEEDYLKQVKARADGLEIELEVGLGSICPTSATFAQSGTGVPRAHSSDLGNAEVAVADLRCMVRIADALGSSTVHCYLGHEADRRTELPIGAHIESTIRRRKALL
jgi:hypothetical protein